MVAAAALSVPDMVGAVIVGDVARTTAPLPVADVVPVPPLVIGSVP